MVLHFLAPLNPQPPFILADDLQKVHAPPRPNKDRPHKERGTTVQQGKALALLFEHTFLKNEPSSRPYHPLIV